MADNNIELFNRAAHTLKSSSASLGAMRLSSQSKELEQQSLEVGLTTLKNKVESAILEFDTVKSVLLSKRPVA